MRVPLLLALVALVGCKSEPKAPQDLNKNFEDPAMNVAEFIEVFESEDRAVFVHRDEIVEALRLKAGDSVADIGAGTGFFVEPVAKRIGPEGLIYTVEISPSFLKHLKGMAAKEPRLKVIEGSDDSVMLPPESVDLVLVVDTYHHFDKPQAVLQSIHAALKPGGRLAVIDFIKIPGVTTDEWVLSHVRGGEAEFALEIEAAGFRRAAAPQLPFLKQVYLAVFERPSK